MSALPGARSERDLAIIATVGRSLLEAVDLDEQLALVLRLATDAISADRGSIMLIDTDDGRLRVRSAEGLPPEALDARIPLGDGIAGWVAQQNEPLILHGGVRDERFYGNDPSIDSSLSLPLAVSEKVLGVINLVRKSGERFTDGDLRLAAALADLSSVAIEKAGLYTALKEREARVSELLAAIIGAQEQERRRVAAEIHDGFLQDLTALFMRAEMARTQAMKGQIAQTVETIEKLQQSMRDGVEGIRKFIFEVRPPSLDEVGLGPTIGAMVQRVAADNNLEPTFVDRLGGRRLHESLETTLYRTAQEALRNIVRHAEAQNVYVTLERDGTSARLKVGDDGKGVDPSSDPRRQGHYGIDTMRERVELAGGSFKISRRPEGGTEVVAEVPAD